MAISFSRPDPSSPAAVGSAAFPLVRRGFDQGEVRDFLRMVAAELARLQERERFLESELRAMQTRGMSTPGRLDEETVTALLGEEAARVLSTARDASMQIRERAEESATRLVKDAAEDASRIREAAQTDAVRIREDAGNDAEAEIEMAKQQGREMVNEAREYREKVLAELARRRDAAREQIDKLLHGRDRLINAFERARIASESVIGELTEAHDEPEFLVDLAPTTGPVPVINPAHPSFNPPVKMFDREAEEDRGGSPRSGAVTPRASTRSVIDIPIDEPAVSTVTTRPTPVGEGASADVLDDVVVVEEDIVVLEVTVGENGFAPVEETSIEDESVIDDAPSTIVGDSGADVEGEDEPTPSNVVSLFGRGRRTPEVPMVPEVPAAVTVPVEPDVVTVPEIPMVPEVPTVSDAGDDHDLSEHNEPEPRAHRAPHAIDATLDDIFAKLRATSTADVARQANDGARKSATSDKPETSRKTAKADKPANARKTPKIDVSVKVSDTVFAARDELVTRLAPTIARRLKRALVDEQNSVLECLRAKKSSLELDAMFGTVVEHTARYVAAITTEVMEAAGAGAKAAKGSTRRVTVDDLSASMSAVVAGMLVEAFREDARTALSADDDRTAMAERMRDLYRSWKSERIDSVVEDVTREAHSYGVLLSLEPGVNVAWAVAPDGCCSDCEDNSLAGVQAQGVAFPAGQTHAPAHAGCRCLVWPVRN